MTLVSLVIPLYNEEDNVAALYNEVCRVADKFNLNIEIVMVDDGSRDRTAEVLQKVCSGDARVKVIRFRRNFGQTAAMAAGLDYASGDIIITLDGDLQNDPAEIPKLIAKIEEGYDFVAGWRKNRQDAVLSRKIPSFLANRLISNLTKVELHDYGCTLKAMRSEVAKNIQLYGEMHRFIPALAAEYGVKMAEVPVNHRPRIHGTSKYGISRTFRVVLDLLTVKFFMRFATRPLHMFGAMGMLTGGLGFLSLVMMTFQRFVYSVPMGNRPLLLLSVLCILVGVQFLCFGLLAEVLARTYHESQNKKIYTVREVIKMGEINGEGNQNATSRRVAAA